MVQYDVINPKHFRECMKDKKIILFGAGEVGENALADMEIKKRVVGVVDNSKEKWGRDFHGYIVQSPEILMNTSKLVLITCRYIYDIIEQCEWLNVQYYFHYETLKYIEDSGRNVELNSNVLETSIQDIYNVWSECGFYCHSMGLIDDIMYTNSREAFERNYSMGCRFFEIDLKKIADGKIVACHGGDIFRNVLKCKGEVETFLMHNTFNSLDEMGYPIDSIRFTKEKVYGKYEVLLWEDIVKLMQKNEDVYFILDIKGMFKEFYEHINTISEDICRRFIIQVGRNQGNWVEKFRKIGVEIIHLGEDYGGKLEGRGTNAELIDACIKYKIGVLAVGKRRINDNLVMLAKKYGIRLCAYTQINTENTISELRSKGVSIFCIEDYKIAKMIKGD